MTTYKEELGARLTSFITSNSIKKLHFAKKIGVDFSHLRKWREGITSPSAEALANISKAYPKLDLEWLLTGSYKESFDSELEVIFKNILYDIQKESSESESISISIKWDIAKKLYPMEVRELKGIKELLLNVNIEKDKEKKTINELNRLQSKRRELTVTISCLDEEDKEVYENVRIKLNHIEESLKKYISKVKKRCHELNPKTEDIQIYA